MQPVLTIVVRFMCCQPALSRPLQSFTPILSWDFRFSVTLAAAFVAVMVVRGLFGWQRRRLADQLFRQLPDTVSMVTSAVRSGLPVNEAFRAIAREMPQPTAGQFAIVCNELALGRPPEEAVEGI